MSFDPDFIITINGEQVTGYVFHWVLTDDEKKSTLSVFIKNPDQKWSNKFDAGQKVSIIFGYVGNTGEKVEMVIRTLEECYSVDEAHDYIHVVGVDCLDALEGGDKKTGGEKVEPPPDPNQGKPSGGGGKQVDNVKDKSAKQVAKAICEEYGITVNFGSNIQDSRIKGGFVFCGLTDMEALNTMVKSMGVKA